LFIEVCAPLDQTSPHGVVPMENEASSESCTDTDADWQNTSCEKKHSDSTKVKTEQGGDADEGGADEDKLKDKVGAVVQRDTLAQLLDYSNLDNAMPLPNILLILVSFEFYEHEWELVDYLLDAVMDSVAHRGRGTGGEKRRG
jgi:hypothetical protein